MRPDAGEEFAETLAAILPEGNDATLIARTALARLSREMRNCTLPSWPETLAAIGTLSLAAQSRLRERFQRAFEADG
jgi:hypothetical protein